MIRCELEKGRYPSFPLSKKTIESAVAQALRASKMERLIRGADIRLSVALVSDASMRKLNRRRRGKDKATDVLSFPLLMWEEGVRYPEIDLGEIYLAPAYISRKPELEESTLKEHALFLTVHAILHLLGHDHMIAGERRTMERLEDRILKQLR